MTMKGIIGKKIGTTQVFRETGEAVSVTAIQAGPCTVTQVKTLEKDGYAAIQVGYQQVRKRNKPDSGHLKQTGKLFRYLREFKTDSVNDTDVGQDFDVGIFQLGDIVDAVGLSKGRGFAGGVKRHGFRGGPKTHGQSDRHRAPGSIGAGSSPGRVIKGLRMAGRMGNARVSARNLEVMGTDTSKNLLLLRGSVPGAQNSLVIIQKTR